MNVLNEIWKSLRASGHYSKSYEEFESKVKDPAYRNKVMNVMRAGGLLSDEMSSVLKEGGLESPKQKAIDKMAEGSSKKKDITTASSLADGSSDSQESFKRLLTERKSQVPISDVTAVDRPKNEYERKKLSNEIAETQRKKTEKSLYEALDLNALKAEEAKKAEEQQAISLEVGKSPEFQNILNVVDSRIIGKKEESVVPDLNKTFGKYGFTFEETGLGDAMIVRSFDGKNSIKIELDVPEDGVRKFQAEKLRNFLSSYGTEKIQLENEDFLRKSHRAQNLRNVGRLNDDGSESTVKMTSFESDGKFYAIPTLFPKDQNNYTNSPKDWVELPFKDAFELAKQRGEVFEFKTDKEAKDFAKGAWKDVNVRDIEADDFYRKRGLDYITEKKRYEKYQELSNLIDFIEGDNEGSKEAIMKSNPELFVKGQLRKDADEYVKGLKKQRDELGEVVNDYGFFTDGKVAKAREDWDVELDRRQSQIATKAAVLNNFSKGLENKLNEESIKLTGVPVNELAKYVDANLFFKDDKKTELIKNYYALKQMQNSAASMYEISKTYYDAKVDKQVRGEYQENLKGFLSANKAALDRGMIGEQLLSFSLPGGKDISNIKDRQEAANEISQLYKDMMSQGESKTMARWRKAHGLAEEFKVFASDPAELLLTFVSTSISQILPYGSKIISSSVAAGASAGAVAGLAGGPFAEVTVPGGALAGAGYGFRGGMAVTNLAAEYTNALMDAVEKKGYNLLDPQSLEKALADQSVWEEGKAVGLSRGIPIAVADYLTGGLAGRVFKPASKVATTATKLGRDVVERVVVDPVGEAIGELGAQSSEIITGTGRKELSWKEIREEGMGGFGQQTINYGFNRMMDLRNQNNIDIAQSLTNISTVASETASDERISTWANNMHQLKKIDADMNQRIQQNIGLRRQAREVLSVGTDKKVEPGVTNRVMELLSAKEELSSTQNRREVYRDKIQQINKEISAIGESKKLLPQEQSVDLSTIIGTQRAGIAQYTIDGRRFTKEQFLKKVDGMTKDQIERTVLAVKNDPETSNLIKKKYAIQEQAAGQVPVQPTTGVGKKVEEGVPQPKLEITPEKSKKELPEGVTIIDAVDEDGEPDYEAEDTLRALAKKRGIGITSDREVAQVARDADGNIIGGTFTSYDNADGKYTFDVVVDEAYEGKGIGSNLLDAVKNVPSYIAEMNPDAKVEVDVVNPTMQKMLESRGFEVTKQLGEGRVLMEPKSEQQPTVSVKTPTVAQPKVGQVNAPIELHKMKEFSQVESRAKNVGQKTIIRQAVKALKSLQSIIPNIEIILHDNNESYFNAAGKKSRGEFQYNDAGVRRIHINLAKANTATMAHEAAHAVFLHAFGENPVLMAKFKDKIAKLLLSQKGKQIVKSDRGTFTLHEYLEDFASRYANESIRPEEYLAELSGLIAGIGAKLDQSILQKIAALVNTIVTKATGGKIKVFENIKDTRDVVDFFNSMSNSFKKGEAIAEAPQRLREKFGKGVVSEGAKAQMPISDIDVRDIRTKNRPGKKISKGLSVYTKDKKKVIEEAKDLSIEYVKENAPELFISNANIIASYPIVSGVKKFGAIKTLDKAQEVYDIFTNQIADNLKYLIDNFDPEYRDISTLWYDGANIIAQNLSNKYGITEEQVAGIIASLSPQKDWYQNVRLAELVMMAFSENPVMTSQMIAKQKSILKEGEAPKLKAIRKAEEKYKLSRSKKNLESLSAKKKAHEKYMIKANNTVSNLEKYIGKSLNDVPDYIKPYMVRLHNEINTTKDYDVLRPDGEPMGVALKKDGVTKAKVAWGSYVEIGKAVSIYLDGSQENITRSLGEMHKIRNFYNNIIDPMSKENDVTMDTHAVAAALLMPLSGNSKEVGQNFGTGTSNSAPLGIKGLYYAFAEGYKKAAEDVNLLPRQVQSITWEAVRGLFTDTFKRDKAQVAKIKNIWDKFVNNKIDINEARKEIVNSAGGINPPTWATGGRGPVQEGVRGDVERGGVGRGGGVSERPAVGGKPGGRGGVVSKAQLTESKFIRDIGVLITPATVRGFDATTERIKKLSLKYDELVKQYAKTQSKATGDEIKRIEGRILDNVREKLTNDISKIKGASVKFGPARIGLWDNKFEPSFNMTLSVSPELNSDEISNLLFDFGERYSQDAFILETDSELNDKYINGEISLPLTEFDADGLNNYPQIVYTFADRINDNQVAELSNELQKNGIDAFSINNNELKISVLTFLSDEQTQNLSEDEQYAEKYRDFESKADAAATSVGDVLGRNENASLEIRIKKSHYAGAKNEGTQEQTREYDRSDIFKPFLKVTSKAQLTEEEVADVAKRLDGLGESKINELPFLFNHSTQMFDSFGEEIKFDTFNHGYRIFRVGDVQVEPIWFSKKPYAEGDDIRQIKAVIQTKNIFDFNNESQVNKLESFAVSKYGDKYNGIADVIRDGNWESIETDYNGSIPAIIKDAGYDSYYSKEGNEITVAVFDPSKIKIATTKNIAYAYIQAKQDGSNPELVKAVEEAIGMKSKAQLTEEELPGYDRMMGEVEGIVEKSKSRGVSPDKIFENVMNYVKGSKVYETADDVQREQIVRDIRKMFGKREKAAPSFAKIFGVIKDTKKITMSERELLKKQIRDLARGARDAKKAMNETRESIASALRGMVRSGKLSSNQAATVLRKYSRVDLLNPAKVSDFVDYMVNVFADAEYVEKISRAKKLVARAKKNIKSKLGSGVNIVPDMERILSISPEMIPNNVMDVYMSILEVMGSTEAVLSLPEIGEMTTMINNVLDAVDTQHSLAEELALRFDAYEDKVFEDGKLKFEKTLEKMIEEDKITEEDAALMRKYKNQIIEEEREDTVQEEEDNTELISTVKSTDVNESKLPMREDRDKARRLSELAKTNAVNSLNKRDLNALLKIIDNINNGYMPHSAQLMIEKLVSINNSDLITKAIEKSKLAPISSVVARMKKIFSKSKDAVQLMVERNPLYYIDQMLGDYKSKAVFNTIFEKLSEAQAVFNNKSNALTKRLEDVKNNVLKSVGGKMNNLIMSSYKMSTYMRELEYLSNPGSKKVNSAVDYLKATIKHMNTNLKFAEAKMLQDILDNYVVDGKLDIDKLYNSFNSAEKNAIKEFQKINEEMFPMAIHTAGVVRGNRIKPINNYSHIQVLTDYGTSSEASAISDATDYGKRLMPSTKGKSLLERKDKVSVLPIEFDIFSSVERGARFVMLDYYMTEPIRIVHRTLNRVNKNLEASDKINKKNLKVFNAIKLGVQSAIENVLLNNYIMNSWIDDVSNFITKQGYRAILAGVARSSAEFASNLSMAIKNPIAFAKGVKMYGMIFTPDAVDFANNVGSKQTERLFGSDPLSGKMIESSLISKRAGIRSMEVRNSVVNYIEMLYNKSLKKYKNSVELIADTLISTPDKSVLRPIWFGSFAQKFEDIRGRKFTDSDFKMIASNDERYMSENAYVIDMAKKYADENSVYAGATDNPFMGILKGKSSIEKSVAMKLIDNFNNFMTRFAIFEYTSARTGINAMVGNGTMSKAEGARLLAAVVLRMTMYSILTKEFAELLARPWTDDDDDEEDEKSFNQKVGQAAASTGVSLILGRDFGNFARGLISIGAEDVNEKFLQELRNGEYDPYKDAITYSIVPTDNTLEGYIIRMSGSLGPALKTAQLMLKNSGKRKEAEAIKIQEQNKNLRIPLELAGHAGLVPFYKDIRSIVVNEINKSIEQQEKRTKANKEKSKAEASKNIKKVRDAKNRMRMMNIEITPGVDSVLNDYTRYYEEKQSESPDAKFINDFDEMRRERDEMKEKLLDEAKAFSITEIKKINPAAYRKNFGPGSEYYRKYNDLNIVERNMKGVKKKWGED